MPAPDPRANPLLLGHEAAEAAFAAALRTGRLHHAWLLTGPPGIGKATLAYRFARHLLAGGSGADGLALPTEHPVFRRVAAGTHADLLTIERGWDDKKKRIRSEIIVDQVRDASDFLHLTPAEGGWRVVVLDGAEDLNRNAANALLKALEEPPARAVLLLTCAAPGRLLPTIRSRCRRLPLAPLAPEPMVTLLARYLPDLGDAQRAGLAAVADGAPGRALLLAEEEGLRLADLVEEVLRAAPALDPARALDVADRLGKSETAFGTFMDLLQRGIAHAVRDSLRGRAGPERERMVAALSLDAWGDVWHGLSRLRDETERFNLDKRQAIVSGLALFSGSVQSPS